jgi:hypothetical protein
MDKLSPKARFDALAGVLSFDDACVDRVRNSIRLLLPHVNELVRRVDVSMQHQSAQAVYGELPKDLQERLQSLLASFIMRTINCNFDDEYCNYAVEISHAEDVPPRMFATGLSLANDFVAETLPGAVDSADQLKGMLTAWNRLTSVLRELTRK